MAEMPLEKVIKVFEAWKSETVEISRINGIKNLLIFENKGEIDNLNFGTWSVVATETFNKHTEPVTCLELLPNNRIASGSTDTSVLVWSLDKFQCVNEFLGHWGPVECLCAYGGNQVISGSSDKTIRVWDSELNECPRTLLGHTNGVTSLQIIEGHYLLSGAGLFSAIIWDLNTGNLLVHFKGKI